MLSKTNVKEQIRIHFYNLRQYQKTYNLFLHFCIHMGDIYICNGTSSNNFGSSSRKNFKWRLGVNRFGSTKGPIMLLPIKPHHMFITMRCWKFFSNFAWGFSKDHMCKLCILIVFSLVNVYSSVNSMLSNRSWCPKSHWQNSIRAW